METSKLEAGEACEASELCNAIGAVCNKQDCSNEIVLHALISLLQSHSRNLGIGEFTAIAGDGYTVTLYKSKQPEVKNESIH